MKIMNNQIAFKGDYRVDYSKASSKQQNRLNRAVLNKLQTIPIGDEERETVEVDADRPGVLNIHCLDENDEDVEKRLKAVEALKAGRVSHQKLS